MASTEEERKSAWWNTALDREISYISGAMHTERYQKMKNAKANDSMVLGLVMAMLEDSDASGDE